MAIHDPVQGSIPPRVAILDGRQPESLTLAKLTEPFPMVLSERREQWGFEAKE